MRFMRNRRMRAWLGGAAVIAVALVAGCSSSGAGNGSDSSAKNLRASWWGGDSRAKKFNDIIHGYEATQNGTTFETSFTAFDQYFPRLATEAAGKSLPDALFITERQIADFAPALLDLQPYVDSGKLDLSSYPASFIQAGKYDGKLRMMPVGATYPTVQFNQSLFDEAGLPYPSGDWTWDDVKKVAVQLTQKLGKGRWGMQDSGGIGTLFEDFLIQRDKTLFDGTKLNFAESDLADWLKLWDDLRKAGATPPGQVTVETASNTFENSLFGTHKVAMFYTSHNQLPTFQGFMSKDVLGLAPDPVAGSTRKTLLIGTDIAVAANTRNPDAAVGLLNYWINDPKAIDLFGVEFGSLPSSKAVDQITKNASPAIKKVLQFGTGVEKMTQASSPRPKGGTKVETIIGQANEAVASGSLSVDAAAKQFYQQAQDAVR